MTGTLYRQRRRFTVTVLATMLALAWQFGAGIYVLHAGLAASALSVVVVLIAEPFRRGLEAASLGLLAAALLPGPLLALVPFWILMSGVVWYALYGVWADRTPLRLRIVSHRHSRAPRHPADVWAAMIPGESHPEDHWTGHLVDFDRDPDDPDTVYLRFEARSGLVEEMTLTFLDKSAPRSCRYVLESEAPGEDRVMAVQLSEVAPGLTEITTRMDMDRLLPRMALARWFDDVFGDELDAFAATLSARRIWRMVGLRTRSADQARPA